MKIFLEQKKFLDTETEFFLRNISTIEDFLYELDSEFVRKEAADFFDIMDLIFIETEANIRPWSHSHEKVLYKNSINVNTILCAKEEEENFSIHYVN